MFLLTCLMTFGHDYRLLFKRLLIRWSDFRYTEKIRNTMLSEDSSMVSWHLRGYWSKKFSDDESASSVLFVSCTWTKRGTVCVLSVWNGNPFGQKLYEASSICKGYSGKKISDDQSSSFVLLVSFTGTKRDTVFVLSVWNGNPFNQKLYVIVLDLDLRVSKPYFPWLVS